MGRSRYEQGRCLSYLRKTFEDLSPTDVQEKIQIIMKALGIENLDPKDFSVIVFQPMKNIWLRVIRGSLRGSLA